MADKGTIESISNDNREQEETLKRTVSFDDQFSDFGSDEEEDVIVQDIDRVRVGDELWIDHIEDELPEKTYIEMERSIVNEKEAKVSAPDSSEMRNFVTSMNDLTILYNESMDISGVPICPINTTLTNHEIKDMDWTYLEDEPGQIVVGHGPREKEQLPDGYEKSFIDKGCQDHFDIVNDRKFICTFQQLENLTKWLRCPECSSPMEILKYNMNGSVAEVHFQCEQGHINMWSSSMKINKVYAVNFQLACAVLLSGSLFIKVAMLFKFLNLGILSCSTFNRITRLYAVPAIEEWWAKMQDEMFTLLKGQELIVGGDGRNDSPGHSSTYCQYTFMDTFSNLIIHQELIDVREADHKSPNMEKIGCQRGLEYLIDNVIIHGIVTDSHPQITAMIGKSILYSLVWELFFAIWKEEITAP